MLPILDLSLRGGAAAVLAFLAIAVLRDGYRTRTGRCAAAFVLSTIGFAVASAPGLVGQAALWLVPFQTGMYASPALLWLFAASLFDDSFDHPGRQLAACAVLVALGFACLQGHLPLVNLVSAGLGLACVGLAIRHAVSGRAEDLVEGRRRFRVIFIVAVGLFSAAVILTDLLVGDAVAGPALDVARLVILLSLTFVFGLALIGVARDGPLLLLPAPPQAAALRAASPPAAETEQETAALAALAALMERDRAYREEGLTIAALATRLGLPEYRLRRLINQRLQYRNFNEFLNRYRLAEATGALADPDQAEVPVLTIALDAGFGSIGPFNRAFKAQTGLTPTEYRREKLGRAAPKLAGSEIGQAESEAGKKLDLISPMVARR